MEPVLWSELGHEEREKVSSLIIEFSTAAVSWNNEEQNNVLNLFTKLMNACQEEHRIKPHQLVVVSKMLQEAAISDLYEWLPEDFEKWEDKDELMAMFFFGQKGLESYRKAKENA
ncbi:hypothetical protein [Halalkalibacterium ligniniphilum]|uniref:hypothetical protein n=1 Tax=Halalkalibacterium ligniniphilum TaxID=1134413 RepID=UPI0003494B5E|nr:hypothetical protein [Halalkalibacterium ligniniphilum]